MAFALPILPEHRFRGQPFLSAKENRAPLSDGPYRVVSWKAQESVTLERNPRVWGPPGHFDRIVFRILPDNTTAYRLLTSGELDENQMEAFQKFRASTDADFLACCRTVEFYNWTEYVAWKQPLAFLRRRAGAPGDSMLSDVLDRRSSIGARPDNPGPWIGLVAYEATSSLPWTEPGGRLWGRRGGGTPRKGTPTRGGG